MNKILALAVLAAIGSSSIANETHFIIGTRAPTDDDVSIIKQTSTGDDIVVFTAPYLLSKLSDGCEFGHYVESLHIFSKRERKVTFIVCDSSPHVDIDHFEHTVSNNVHFTFTNSGDIHGEANFDINKRAVLVTKEKSGRSQQAASGY